VPEGVVEQVEQHALELLRARAHRGRRVVHGAAEPDPRPVRASTHALDRLLDQLSEVDRLEAPGDVARLDARELEEVVDEALERPEVKGDLL